MECKSHHGPPHSIRGSAMPTTPSLHVLRVLEFVSYWQLYNIVRYTEYHLKGSTEYYNAIGRHWIRI